MSSTARTFLRAITAVLVLLAVGPLSSAAAEGEPELLAPVITQNPSSTSVAAGSQASFTASATGATEVQWEVSTNGGGSWAPDASDTGNNTEMLTVVTTAAMNGYEYRAVFGNALGHAESAPATLTVESAPVESAPIVTSNPISVSVAAGQTATFSAAATGALNVQWQYRSGSEWKNVEGATSNILSFTAQTSYNGLQLRAVFTNSAGKAESAPATLSVGTAPQVTSSPASVSVTAGSAVSFTAAASGEPAPTVQWKVSTNGGGSWSSVQDGNSNTLSLTVAQGQNGDEYRAVFTNKWGSSETAPATLTVYTAPAMTLQPTSLSVVAGEAATFTAAASGAPTPSVQWEVLSSASPQWSPVAGATSPTFTLAHPTTANSGRVYHAVFTNPAGSVTSAEVTLTVAAHSEAPAITSQPADVRVKAGETATFTAHSGGVPTPHVQWEVSTDLGEQWGADTTDPGNNTEAITVAASSAKNGYQYRAVFTNTVASATTSPATLIVESPPPAASTSVVPAGSPKASFAWFPLSPRAGEAVSLVSSSTDPTGAITAFAWDQTGVGAFTPGGPVLTTSFSSPGNHVVHLRVTDAGGLSSVVAETITVRPRQLFLMQPFPIVRIAGFDTSFGAQLSLLTTQAPVGARITLVCRGRGCPVKQEIRVVVSARRRGASVLVAFKRFERALPAGTVLQIRIWKAGQIGKYTSFTVRRHKLPVRVDACLDPADSKPIACPAS
jgi:immunoglobulin I-set domain protein/PKD domain-containing protein